ncbi:MAG TPA: PDZ domain-containing protein [Candidatus Limnocylindrales bacterium]|nr:PDZ domain-containing protein [Candidatus Limnocylindrales bacterium]
MPLSQALRPAGSLAALGLALSLLVAPMAARAQDDQDDQDNGRSGTVRIYQNKDDNSASGGGFLGVQVQDVTRALQRARNLPTEEGALVNRVEQDSPADRNGIRRGDVIVEINGDKVQDSADLIRSVRQLDAGSKVRITLWRSGALRTITAQLDVRPKTRPGMPGMPPNMGGWGTGNDDGDAPMAMPMPPTMGDRDQVRQQIRELRKELEQLREEVRALRAELHQSNDDNDNRSRDNGDND